MSSSSNAGGIGFFGVLGIVFIALKLMGFLAWSWWWVLAPLWGPVVIALAVIAASLAFLAIQEARLDRQVKKAAERRRGGGRAGSGYTGGTPRGGSHPRPDDGDNLE